MSDKKQETNITMERYKFIAGLSKKRKDVPNSRRDDSLSYMEALRLGAKKINEGFGEEEDSE